MNKTTKALAALVCGALLLTGCGSSKAAPTVTVTEQSQDNYVAPVVTDEDRYVENVRSLSNGNSVIDNSPDSSIISAGYGVCEGLDSGLTVEQVFNISLETAANQYDPQAAAYAYGVVIGSAVAVFCPQYASETQRFLSKYLNG